MRKSTLGRTALREELCTIRSARREEINTIGTTLREELCTIRTARHEEINTIGTALREELCTIRTALRGELLCTILQLEVLVECKPPPS